MKIQNKKWKNELYIYISAIEGILSFGIFKLRVVNDSKLYKTFWHFEHFVILRKNPCVAICNFDVLLSLSIYVYIHTYICIYIYMCIWICYMCVHKNKLKKNK